MTDEPNPLNRDRKVLKAQARDFVHKIQKSLRESGLQCTLSATVTIHQGTSLVVVSFRFQDETESAPMSYVPTAMMLAQPDKAEAEVIQQIYEALKTLQRIAEGDTTEEEEPVVL